MEVLATFSDLTVDGVQAVVRNGYLPERTIQTAGRYSRQGTEGACSLRPRHQIQQSVGATGLSAHTVSRLKLRWEQDYDQWRHRDLSKRRYVYSWADGVYCNVRMDDRLCLPVLTGLDDTGRKAVLAVVDGYRESEAGWVEVTEQRESQGLPAPP